MNAAFERLAPALLVHKGAEGSGIFEVLSKRGSEAEGVINKGLLGLTAPPRLGLMLS